MDLNDPRFGDDELATNKEYLSPIPKSEGTGSNADFSLLNMKGLVLLLVQSLQSTLAQSFLHKPINIIFSTASKVCCSISPWI